MTDPGVIKRHKYDALHIIHRAGNSSGREQKKALGRR
jgi:hypothetical protein